VKASLWIWLILMISAAGVETAAIAQNAMPEIRFPDADQNKGSAPPSAAPPQPGASAGWVHPMPHHPDAAGSGRGSVADQLNRAELNRILGRGRGAGRATIR
jgi:hypothetical protein